MCDPFICVTRIIHMYAMGWLRLVGSLKLQVSFAKEPYKRDHILRVRPMIWMSLLIVGTAYRDLLQQGTAAMISVTWPIHMCNMTHSHVWHDSSICATWHIHMCDMTHSYLFHCDTAGKEGPARRRVHLWHDAFICVIHSYESHDSSTCMPLWYSSKTSAAATTMSAHVRAWFVARICVWFVTHGCVWFVSRMYVGYCSKRRAAATTMSTFSNSKEKAEPRGLTMTIWRCVSFSNNSAPRPTHRRLSPRSWTATGVCGCVCGHARAFFCVFGCMYVYVLVCLFVCMYVCMYACIYVCMHVYMCMCEYLAYMHVCRCMLWPVSCLSAAAIAKRLNKLGLFMGGAVNGEWSEVIYTYFVFYLYIHICLCVYT